MTAQVGLNELIVKLRSIDVRESVLLPWDECPKEWGARPEFGATLVHGPKKFRMEPGPRGMQITRTV